MIKFWLALCAFGFVGFVCAAVDIQTAEGRSQERLRIEAERKVNDARLDAQDRECQARFIVTSCREAVRLERIKSQDALRRQEGILNRLDRQAAAAKQQRKLEDKQR
jgi:colicin import membrane protein